MYQIFHPRTRHWITRIVWIFILTVPAIYVALEGFFICAFWPVLFLGLSLMDLHLLKRTHLRLDEQNYLFQRGKSKVQGFWKDLLMVRQVPRLWNQAYLELATQDEIFVVPLGYFDAAQVWSWVQRYAPAEALQPDAYKRLSAYQEWAIKVQKLVSNEQGPLRAGYPLGTKIMLGFLLVLFGLIGSLLLAAPHFFGIILCFPLIVILGGWAVSSIFYRVEMNSEEIIATDFWRNQRMRWDEIRYIEHDFGQHRFVFYGQNKRLAIIGPQFLEGKDKVEMLEMLQAQIHYRKLDLYHKERALFTWSQNVSVEKPV